MRVLIDRIEVRVARAEERARGERMGTLVRQRLGEALGGDASAPPPRTAAAPPPAGARASRAGGGPDES